MGHEPLATTTEETGAAQPIARGRDQRTRARRKTTFREVVVMTWFDEAAKVKHYSQSGEAGVIDELARRLDIVPGLFIECGAGDGKTLSNTRHLADAGWMGQWIENDPELFRKANAERINHRLNVDVVQRTCRAGTLDHQCEVHGWDTFDLLSLDIDGNDYWVWKAMKREPRIVCIEYNAGFPPTERRTIAYDPEFRFANSDYHGATAGALHALGKEKGYRLVAYCGVNLFFVHESVAGDLPEVPIEEVPWRRSWRKDEREMVEV